MEKYYIMSKDSIHSARMYDKWWYCHTILRKWYKWCISLTFDDSLEYCDDLYYQPRCGEIVCLVAPVRPFVCALHVPQRYRTTLCTIDLHCAPLTCIVHHWPALCTMVHVEAILVVHNLALYWLGGTQDDFACCYQLHLWWSIPCCQSSCLSALTGGFLQLCTCIFWFLLQSYDWCSMIQHDKSLQILQLTAYNIKHSPLCPKGQ